MSDQPPPTDARRAADIGSLGMWMFIASLSVLFAASMVGYLAIRIRAETWPPPGAQGLPWTIWLSTLAIVAGSVTVHSALRAIKADNGAGCRTGMALTLGLMVVFLIVQTINWMQMAETNSMTDARQYAATFYMLTGLHAAHVIGGLVLLVIVTRNAFRGVYNAGYYPGVAYSTMYLHFLDLVWLVMFVVLLMAG